MVFNKKNTNVGITGKFKAIYVNLNVQQPTEFATKVNSFSLNVQQPTEFAMKVNSFSSELLVCIW